LIEIRKEYNDLLMNWAVAYKMKDAESVESILHKVLKNRGRHRYAEVHKCGVHEVIDMLEKGIKDERINWKVVERRKQRWYSKETEERALDCMRKATFMRDIGYEVSGSCDNVVILHGGMEQKKLSYIADDLLFYLSAGDLGLASMYEELRGGVGGC